MTTYSFKGTVVLDLGKLGLQEKTTITYPVDYLNAFLKSTMGEEIIITIELEVKK